MGWRWLASSALAQPTTMQQSNVGAAAAVLAGRLPPTRRWAPAARHGSACTPAAGPPCKGGRAAAGGAREERKWVQARHACVPRKPRWTCMPCAVARGPASAPAEGLLLLAAELEEDLLQRLRGQAGDACHRVAAAAAACRCRRPSRPLERACRCRLLLLLAPAALAALVLLIIVLRAVEVVRLGRGCSSCARLLLVQSRRRSAALAALAQHHTALDQGAALALGRRLARCRLLHAPLVLLPHSSLQGRPRRGPPRLHAGRNCDGNDSRATDVCDAATAQRPKRRRPPRVRLQRLFHGPLDGIACAVYNVVIGAWHSMQASSSERERSKRGGAAVRRPVERGREAKGHCCIGAKLCVARGCGASSPRPRKNDGLRKCVCGGRVMWGRRVAASIESCC